MAPFDNEKPFLMSVEDVFTMGRGTVATGRSDGHRNTGDEVDILGLTATA